MTKSPTELDGRIGGRLRAAREAAGMSQEALADRLGLTFQQVQKYEKGRNRIPASRLQEIARLLKMPVSYFYDSEPGETGRVELLPDRDTRRLFEIYNGLPQHEKACILQLSDIFARRDGRAGDRSGAANSAGPLPASSSGSIVAQA